MSLGLVTQKSLSLFSAVGGWRTVAEGVASRALFLVAYLVTGQVLTSALVAVGGVVVLAVVRLCTGGKVWQPAVGVLVVAASAVLAGSTGNAADFYLSAVVVQAVGGALFLVSLLVRWPVIGVVLGTVAKASLGDAIAGSGGGMRCARRCSWRSSPSPQRCWCRCTRPGRCSRSASPPRCWEAPPPPASASTCAGGSCAKTRGWPGSSAPQCGLGCV
jgi:hypothetical protein